MARYLFFSDLHLADGSKIDDFHPEKIPLFLRFAKAIKNSDFDGVFVLGDIYELWQGLGSQKQRLSKAKKVYKPIVDFLEKNTVELYGNHDRKRKYLDPWVLKNKLLEKDGVRIWIEHGDRFDRYSRSFLGRLFAELFSVIEYFFPEKIQESIEMFFEKILRKITPRDPNYPGDFSEYEIGAKKLFAEKNCDLVILGHTHQPLKKIWFENGKEKIYLNSGAWIKNQQDYVIVDTIKKIYEVRSYNGEEKI